MAICNQSSYLRAQRPSTVRRHRHGHPAPRHHHARHHRPHGLQPAPGALDLRHPRPGRRRARERRPRDARPGAGRPQRREGAGHRSEARRRSAPRPTSTRRWPTRTTPSSSTPARPRCASACCARRSRPASTSIARSRCRRRSPKRCRSRRRRKDKGIKSGVVQDKLFLPGLRKIKMLKRLRLLRPHPLGARRVRLLGVRGRLGPAGAAAELELPQEGRRRHHPRYAAALALRARQPVRRGQAVSCLGATHISSRVDESRQDLRRGRRRRRLCHLPARRRRDRAHQFVLVRAREARRPRHLPGRRHPRLGGRRAHPLLHPASREHAAAGVESGRAADHEVRRSNGTRCRTTRSTRTASSCSGRSSSATSSQDAPWKFDLFEGAKGVQLAELAMKSWTERRWIDVPALQAARSARREAP